jgi:uncharacterized Zn-binding protein involved in type VI secretion
MAGAATLFEPTSHPGIITGGASQVYVNGLPAARVGDKHACLLPPNAGPHPASTIVQGSSSVFIEGKAAARQGDKAGCGAAIASGSVDVFIGG